MSSPLSYVDSNTLNVFVENWNTFPTKKVRSYADEEFPGLELEYFVNDPEYAIENGRAFTIKEVPVDEEKAPYSSTMSYSTFGFILGNIEIKGKEVESGSIALNEISDFISKLENKLEEISPQDEKLDSLNSVLPSTHDFVLEYNYRDLLRVAKIALENQRGIFWI